ncbi:DUF927 domain-containing protein [Lentibacillus lipolyticus]|nr:DUF927 domain-containing protein [Lentibacillus lipolyticus]
MTRKIRVVITPQKLIKGESFPINDTVLNNDGVYFKKKDKETGEEKTFKMCEPLFVLETVQNIDDKDVYAVLCYKLHDKYQTIDIGLGQLVPNELIKLMSKGVDVPHEFVKIIATYLREQQKKAPYRVVFQQVGWHKSEDKQMVFRHHEMISNDPTMDAYNDHEGGGYYLEPKGDKEKWIQMTKEQVIGHTPLETILAIGFSSAIVGYLSHYYDDIDNLIFHLAGNSTQGKTTAALYAVSVFGFPSSKKKGLMKTWNGTNNAILNLLGGNFGIPLVLDELSMSKAKSLTDSLYVLASGQEKARLTDTIKQRKQGRWSLTIISTGEQSIFERTNQNPGLTIRTFEHANVQWTTSAENADAIREVIQNNFGHAGKEFVEYLFSQGLDIIESTWKSWQTRCEEAFQETVFRSRISKKYALVMAAADLANQALDLGLDTEEILQFLVDQEDAMVAKRDIGSKAWHKVIQLIIQHQSNFKREGFVTRPYDCWGKMFTQGSYVEVAFLKQVLEQQLKELGFDDPKIVLRDWKSKGWLVTESDRPSKRTQVFDKTEQEARKKVLGKKPPKKLEDTTFNLKVPKKALEGLVRNRSILDSENHLGLGQEE